MIYLLWVLPALVVIGAIASGKVGTSKAAFLGLSVALVVALTTAPMVFGIGDAAVSLGRGAWTGWIVIPYILGGLLFWQMAVRPGPAAAPDHVGRLDAQARRRLLFAACFLIGPFAETATGFGVGIIGTLALVRRLDVPPVYLLAFALLSQTMMLWGGMGNGVIVGAAFARTEPTVLAMHVSCFLLAYHVFWLPIFWRLAHRAGVPAGWREKLSEAAWIASGLASAIAATALLGPEPALLASYGTLIVARHLIDERPSRDQLLVTLGRMAPFVLLIAWLAITRLAPPLSFLKDLVRVQPFPGGPAWAPLFHAGTWLIVAAVLTAVAKGTPHGFGAEVRRAWDTSRLAILSIMSFSMMAELLSGSGIATGLASGLYGLLGPSAVAMTSLISAVFGALANSGSAPNGLFMASQIGLAQQAGLNVAAVVALQYAAALSLNLVSPVRMSIVCGLAGTPGMERAAWMVMMPFTLTMLGVLAVAAALVCLRLV